MVRPLGPGGTATQEFPPRAAEWQRLRLPNFSVSTLSELYIETRKRGEFFLYIFSWCRVCHAETAGRSECNPGLEGAVVAATLHGADQGDTKTFGRDAEPGRDRHWRS
jgi:hypothetical protein